MCDYKFTLDLTAVMVCALLLFVGLLGWLAILHKKCAEAEKAYEEAKKEARGGRDALAKAVARMELLEDNLASVRAKVDVMLGKI